MAQVGIENADSAFAGLIGKMDAFTLMILKECLNKSHPDGFVGRKFSRGFISRRNLSTWSCSSQTFEGFFT